MTYQLSDIIALFRRRLQGETLTAAEDKILEDWRAETVYQREVGDRLLSEDRLEEGLRERLAENYEADWTRLRAAIGAWDKSAPVRAVHRLHFLRSVWIRYAAAVIVLIGIGSGGYFWNKQKSQKEEVALKNAEHPVNEVLPGSDKAVLTLGDGEQVLLDSGVTTVLQANGISIHQGTVVYRSTGMPAALNTLTTPRRGQYKIKLQDGTTAWLNAASSITYPTVFTGSQRVVRITGEVYFEVKKNARHPFIVKTTTDSIEVLGTSFNVNSFDDEPGIKISLIEGKIRVNNSILRPGQAFIKGRVAATDTQQDIAWKEGYFNFNQLPIDAALRQVARWYDVEVRFEKGIPTGSIYGKADRNLTLQELIRGYEGVIAHFRLDGHILFVNPIERKK